MHSSGSITSGYSMMEKFNEKQKLEQRSKVVEVVEKFNKATIDQITDATSMSKERVKQVVRFLEKEHVLERIQ